MLLAHIKPVRWYAALLWHGYVQVWTRNTSRLTMRERLAAKARRDAMLSHSQACSLHIATSMSGGTDSSSGRVPLEGCHDVDVAGRAGRLSSVDLLPCAARQQDLLTTPGAAGCVT
jgi:hypothetical protein